MSAKDRRAMDGPSDPCPGKCEKRKAPNDSFIVVRRHRGGLLSLVTFFAETKNVTRATARN
jgi:hypothetical protein